MAGTKATNANPSKASVQNANTNVNVGDNIAPANPVVVATERSYENIIKKIVADGGKVLKGIGIKNVNFTEKDNYTMISFTLTKAIDGFVSEDDGVTYSKGKTQTLFTSLYAITGALKEDPELGWMANTLLDKPQALNMILNGAEIEVLQQEVEAGEEYSNPFTTRTDGEAQVYDHDWMANNVIRFKLGKTGQKWADRLGDRLLGFDF